MKLSREPAPPVIDEATAAPISDAENTPEKPPHTDVSMPEQSTSNFMNDPNIIAFIEKQVQEGIQKALQGTPPKASTADPTAAEKAAFDKMTYKEKLKLFTSNPHTYNKLAKGVI